MANINELGVLKPISGDLQQVQDEGNQVTTLWVSNQATGVFGPGGQGAEAILYLGTYDLTQANHQPDAAIKTTDLGNATAVMTFQLQPAGGSGPSLVALQLSPDGGVSFPSLPNLPSAGCSLLGVDANGNVVPVTCGPPTPIK